jgi:hypothetical protein
MWNRTFPLAHQYRGALALGPSTVPIRRWSVRPNLKKLTHQEFSGYHAFHEKGCLRIEVCLGVNNRRTGAHSV